MLSAISIQRDNEKIPSECAMLMKGEAKSDRLAHGQYQGTQHFGGGKACKVPMQVMLHDI